MKKNFYIAFALCGALATQVHAYENTNLALGGLSVGLTGGYSLADSKIKRTALTRLDRNSNDTSDVSAKGFLGGAHLEFGHIFSNQLFAGLQLSALTSSLKGNTTAGANSTVASLKTDLKMKNSFGAALRVGRTFGIILPYLKGGIVSSKWQSLTYGTYHGLEGQSLLTSNKKSQNRTGFEVGLGVDFSLSPFVAVGAEVSHLRYKKIRYVYGNDLVGLHQISVKPTENRAMLRVKYKVF